MIRLPKLDSMVVVMATAFPFRSELMWLSPWSGLCRMAPPAAVTSARGSPGGPCPLLEGPTSEGPLLQVVRASMLSQLPPGRLHEGGVPQVPSRSAKASLAASNTGGATPPRGARPPPPPPGGGERLHGPQDLHHRPGAPTRGEGSRQRAPAPPPQGVQIGVGPEVPGGVTPPDPPPSWFRDAPGVP